MTVTTVSTPASGTAAAPGGVERDAAMPDNLSGTDSERAQP